MKILLIEDNVALREVFTKVLTSADHEVESAWTLNKVESIISDFKPDVYIIDTDTKDGIGMEIIDNIVEESLDEVKVILVKGDKNDIPIDNTIIRRCIQKPFNSTDIFNALDNLDNREIPVTEKVAKTKIQIKLRGRKVPVIPAEDTGLIFGTSYVFDRSQTKTMYLLAESFFMEGHDALVLTFDKSKKAYEQMKRDNADLEVIYLSGKPKGGFYNQYPLGTIMDRIYGFIESKDNPVIIIDNINQLIDVNGSNAVQLMINNILSSDSEKWLTLMVSADIRGLSDKDKNLLFKNMISYEPLEE